MPPRGHRAKKRQKWRLSLWYDESYQTKTPTYNGCEFLNPEKIKDAAGCNVYYTRAYASWEKGSVENCNRFVRRWYPKKTDFSRCTRGEMHQLEKVINSIHRRIFNGKTAYEYDTAYSKSA